MTILSEQEGMRRLAGFVMIAGLALMSSVNFGAETQRPALHVAGQKTFLRKNWRLQSSAKVIEKGDKLSTSDFKPEGWHAASVPSTVLGALVEENVYTEPYFGMNLRMIPGCSYPIGANFSRLPMPDDSPFRVSWWYRTEFRLNPAERGRNIWLHFDGINYRANIWLNGHQIAKSDDIAGTFRVHELNVTEMARAGRINTLAVEVFPPQPNDLALTWVDWNPSPPDKNMGIWHDVYITTSGPVALRHPQVITHFDLPSLDTAHLTVNAEAHNASDRPIDGTLAGRIENVEFSQPVKLEPHETKVVRFAPDQYPKLNFSRPRIWWPSKLGPQNLYNLEMEFSEGARTSDHQSTSFGVREVTSEVGADKARVFKVNGKNILIRGGGWAPDMLLRDDPLRLETEFQYVKDMNLNTIRLEGKLESDHFYELADKYGILIIAGWCCCDHWEHWVHRDDYKEGPTWDQENYKIAGLSLTDQVRRLRNHPSLLVWLNGSDNPPPADVEKMYIGILQKYDWPNPYISSATAKPAELTGASGVKMEGPYEWVPPSYWLLDRKMGGAHGFATEISPGPAVPPIESLRKMLPKEHLWPIDDFWSYHAGGGQFKTMKVFNNAINSRYGEARDIEDYAAKAQLMTYEGQRAMFEGYTRNKYVSGGVIQWMLNNAWPSMIWHLYDYYLRPGGGYFGTKKACEPLHVQYSYDDHSIAVINNTYESYPKLKVRARLFDDQLVEKFTKVTDIDLQPDAVVRALTIPQLQGMTPLYFLNLTLERSDNRIISSNFYWLSTKDDVLDWQKSTWYYTPTQSYADFTKLQALPPAQVKAVNRLERRGGEDLMHLTLTNTGRSLAFFIRLQIKRGHNGEELLPVLWQDNFLTLMPGETREINARYRSSDLKGFRPEFVVSGWNVPLSFHSVS